MTPSPVDDRRSGRLATVSLKAEPAPTTAKPSGGAKGSWGKAPPKANAKDEGNNIEGNAGAPSMYTVDRIQ